MTGKERIIAALKGQPTDRTPWLPFVGCHGASLLGVDAKSYLNSGESMVLGAEKAIQLYHPDGMPVLFDLQLEAETLGCRLQWSEDNPPAVHSHPLQEGLKLEDLSLPQLGDWRIGKVMEVCKRLTSSHPAIAWYGLITGPFTLALHLMGTDIFMKMMEEPDQVMEVLDFAKEVAIRMANYYIDAGCDVIAVVDPMTSQIDPMMFEMFISGPVTAIFDAIRDREKFSSFFVCGDAQQNIEVMCDCKPDNLSIDENIPLVTVAEIASAKGVSYGGNLQLTTTLLMGTEDDVRRNVIECLDAATQPGFILAPGCDLPMATPVKNLQTVFPLISDPYQLEIHRNRDLSNADLPLLDLSNYREDSITKVDIITLDSASCAPCQYMVEAVKAACKEIGPGVQWEERSIKQEAGVVFMRSAGVTQVPSICIDGKLAYSSRIPPVEKLISTIQDHMNDKRLETAQN